MVKLGVLFNQEKGTLQSENALEGSLISLPPRKNGKSILITTMNAGGCLYGTGRRIAG
ncbi:hypothetical protein NXY47_00025 [Bacteroides fragilis]|nr:hypothetical protein [Bacteroides fragilis]